MYSNVRTKFFSVLCIGGIVVSILGFEPNALGSNIKFSLYFCQSVANCTELDEDIDMSTIDYLCFHCSS